MHSSVPVRDSHHAYPLAKAGDADAAFELARDLISAETTAQLDAFIDAENPLLLPVIADETTGFNAIPDAMAHVLGGMLGLAVQVGEIVQINKVGHTRAPAFQRLVTPAQFAGEVFADRAYVLVDDHVGLGGTLANLKGFLETNGASVLAITTLTESRDARKISLRPATRAMLWDKHGEALDELWRSQFGHGIDCLTDIEAHNLCRQPSIAAIEDFLAKAAIEARGRGLDPAIA